MTKTNMLIEFDVHEVLPSGKYGKWLKVKVCMDDKLKRIYRSFRAYEEHEAKTKVPMYMGNIAGAAAFLPVDKIQMHSIQTGTLCIGTDAFDNIDEYNDYKKHKHESEVKFNEFYERAGNYLKERGLIGKNDIVEHHLLITQCI